MVPSARSSPTARRRRNHLEVCLSCMAKVTRVSTLSMGQRIIESHPRHLRHEFFYSVHDEGEQGFLTRSTGSSIISNWRKKQSRICLSLVFILDDVSIDVHSIAKSYRPVEGRNHHHQMFSLRYFQNRASALTSTQRWHRWAGGTCRRCHDWTTTRCMICTEWMHEQCPAFAPSQTFGSDDRLRLHEQLKDLDSRMMRTRE